MVDAWEARLLKLAPLPLAVALAACHSHPTFGGADKTHRGIGARPSASASAFKATTAEEQVQHWARGGNVSSAGIVVPGMKLFVVDYQEPSGMDREPSDDLVAVIGGAGGKLLTGQAVMRAVIKATKDADKLARVALLVNHDPAAILQRAHNDQQRHHNVGAPARVKGKVEFWALMGSPYRSLYRGRLDLATGALDFKAVQ